MPSSPDPQRRAYWLKTLHTWHWISSALCLVAMILFAATGITLNNAAHIEAKPVVTQKTAQLPAEVLARLARGPQEGNAPLPASVSEWLGAHLQVEAGNRQAEWSREEVYLALPRPGGDAWLRITRDSGELEYELTERGWISYFNDLHKGRNTGLAWSWFIDLFAVVCLLFCATGLLLLQLHSGNRPLTWPITALGLVVPLVLALLFIH